MASTLLASGLHPMLANHVDFWVEQLGRLRLQGENALFKPLVAYSMSAHSMRPSKLLRNLKAIRAKHYTLQ